jgi:hypothetical protein
MPNAFKCTKANLAELESIEMHLSRAEVINIHDLHKPFVESLPEQKNKSHLAEFRAKELLEHDIVLASRIIIPTKPAKETILAENSNDHESIMYPVFMDSKVELKGIASWLYEAWDHDDMELEETNSIRARSLSPSSMRSRSRSPSVFSQAEEPAPVYTLPESLSQSIRVEPPTIQVFSQSVIQSSQTAPSQSQKSQKPKRKRGF